MCKSSTLDRDRNKSGIGYFPFLSDFTIKKQWVKAISKFRRKGENNSFSIKKTKVYEFHFHINCIRISCAYGKNLLVKGSIPSVFKFKQEPPRKKRKGPKKRYFEPETVTEYDSFMDAFSDSDRHSDHYEKLFINVNSVKNVTETCDSCDLLKVERKGLKKENERLQNLLNESIDWVRLLEEKNNSLQNPAYNYQNLSENC